MNKVPFVLLAAAVASLGVAAPALAQANRTFVSGHGSDGNPCSLTAPCRSFAQALTQTNAGGEIAVLDTAGYGSVTINKAISIVNQDGVEAGVTVTSGDGITVAAGAADVVNLRGLTVVGGGLGTSGITFSGGRSLNIDKCVIRGFTAGGISMVTSATANLTVTDTTVSNNFEGVVIAVPGITTAATTVTLERLHATGNGNSGVSVSPTATAIIVVNLVDSLLDNNATGVFVTTSTSSAFVTVDNTKLFQAPGANPLAVNANGPNTRVNLNRSFLGPGSADFVGGGAQVLSFGTNQAYNQFGNPITF